jgi:hypothetical protein
MTLGDCAQAPEAAARLAIAIALNAAKRSSRFMGAPFVLFAGSGIGAHITHAVALPLQFAPTPPPLEL